MTDRELLEAAAKAAGISWQDWSETWYLGADGQPEVGLRDWLCDWNPLKEDGDALRLMVQLRLSLELRISGATVRWRDAAGSEYFLHQFVEDMTPDKYTRRAIVRAAAEMAPAVGCMPNASLTGAPR